METSSVPATPKQSEMGTTPTGTTKKRVQKNRTPVAVAAIPSKQTITSLPAPDKKTITTTPTTPALPIASVKKNTRTPSAQAKKTPFVEAKKITPAPTKKTTPAPTKKTTPAPTKKLPSTPDRRIETALTTSGEATTTTPTHSKQIPPATCVPGKDSTAPRSPHPATVSSSQSETQTETVAEVSPEMDIEEAVLLQGKAAAQAILETLQTASKCPQEKVPHQKRKSHEAPGVTDSASVTDPKRKKNKGETSRPLLRDETVALEVLEKKRQKRKQKIAMRKQERQAALKLGGVHLEAPAILRYKEKTARQALLRKERKTRLRASAK